MVFMRFQGSGNDHTAGAAVEPMLQPKAARKAPKVFVEIHSSVKTIWPVLRHPGIAPRSGRAPQACGAQRRQAPRRKD